MFAHFFKLECLPFFQLIWGNSLHILVTLYQLYVLQISSPSMWCVSILCSDDQKLITLLGSQWSFSPCDLCFCDLSKKFFPLEPNDMGLNLSSILAGCVAWGRYLISQSLSFVLCKTRTVTACTSRGYSEEARRHLAQRQAHPHHLLHQQTSPRTGTPHRRDGATLLSRRSEFCRRSFRDLSDFSSFCLSAVSSAYKSKHLNRSHSALEV